LELKKSTERVSLTSSASSFLLQLLSEGQQELQRESMSSASSKKAPVLSFQTQEKELCKQHTLSFQLFGPARAVSKESKGAGIELGQPGST